MSDLGAIEVKLKDGSERLGKSGSELPYSLQDFWQWSASDLVSNATRGVLAEFIVATAVGVDLSIPRDEWAAYDLVTSEGIRIEVKSSAYVQSWAQKKLSTISFSIKKSKYWDAKTLERGTESKRQADVYVFCLLNCKDKRKIDPLNLMQWEFYVVNTKTLDEYPRSDTSITLKSLQKLSSAVEYEDILATITEVVNG
jgi:hypothetical protein